MQKHKSSFSLPLRDEHEPYVAVSLPFLPWLTYMMTGAAGVCGAFTRAGHHTKHFTGVPSLIPHNSIMSQGHWDSESDSLSEVSAKFEPRSSLTQILACVCTVRSSYIF